MKNLSNELRQRLLCLEDASSNVVGPFGTSCLFHRESSYRMRPFGGIALKSDFLPGFADSLGATSLRSERKRTSETPRGKGRFKPGTSSGAKNCNESIAS